MSQRETTPRETDGTAPAGMSSDDGNQPSVLIIDDDQGLSRIVAMVLRRSGFQPEVTNSSHDGLRLATEGRYDAIVLDLRMPGKDGRTVYRELRQAGNETPVMILSAYDAREAQLELGAQAFLNKPFEPERLVSTVRNMLAASGS